SSTPPPTCTRRPRRTPARAGRGSRAAGCPSPRRRWRLTVGWYGGGTRRVGVVGGTGPWYKSGRGLVPVRWVFVHDRDGTHRDEYFFSTDLGLPATALSGAYTGRRNIETTFQEPRAPLRLETTRG